MADAGGISRRNAMKKIGAGAAVAWTAPALLTFESRASAASLPSCPPFECHNFPANTSFCAGNGSCGCVQKHGGGSVCTNSVAYLMCNADADCPSGAPICIDVLPGSCAPVYNGLTACARAC